MSAAALRALHVPGRPLVLANVWDAASARLAVAAGFPVVATSSVAVAESLGYRDHEDAPAAEMFAAAARIARVVDVPVTVDAEAGYRLPAGELVEQLLAAGAHGCNLEDTDHTTGGLKDATTQAAWLAEVRAAARTELVINARIDVFVRSKTEPRALLEEATKRARAYLDAGADCVYPIGLRDPAVIRDLVDAVSPAPVNVLTEPDGPAPATFVELGVARVSMGGSVWRANQSVLATRFAELAAR